MKRTDVQHAAPSLQLTACPEPLVEEIFARRQIPVAGGEWEPMEVYIPREQGDLLYSLVRYVLPELTVEVGMANGLSTLFIASGLQDNGAGRHIAIDPYQSADWKQAGITLMGLAGLADRVDVIEKFSHQALPELEQSGRRAQFVFIDGSHLFDYVISDFLCADRILDVGGLMAFDDSDWPAISQALRYIVTNRRYRNRVCLELVINGLWIWRQGANTAEFLPPGIQFVGAGYTADTDSQGAYLLQHIS